MCEQVTATFRRTIIPTILNLLYWLPSLWDYDSTQHWQTAESTKANMRWGVENWGYLIYPPPPSHSKHDLTHQFIFRPCNPWQDHLWSFWHPLTLCLASLTDFLACHRAGKWLEGVRTHNLGPCKMHRVTESLAGDCCSDTLTHVTLRKLAEIRGLEVSSNAVQVGLEKVTRAGIHHFALDTGCLGSPEVEEHHSVGALWIQTVIVKFIWGRSLTLKKKTSAGKLQMSNRTHHNVCFCTCRCLSWAIHIVLFRCFHILPSLGDDHHQKTSHIQGVILKLLV